MYKVLPIFIAILTIFLIPSSVWAFGSSSASYKLEAEFGSFGGAKSSASYNLTDTGGGFAVGFGSSANYGTGSGFQYVIAEVREIVFTISSNTINLGTLSSGSVTSASHTIDVTTNGAGGYQVTVLEDGELRTSGASTITDANGDVDAGSEEYGLATSDTGVDITTWDGACNGTNPELADGITASAQTVASNALPIDNDTSTMCYSASITNTTEAGEYNHVLTYIATGTF
jgi:hypothetical protein